MESCEGSDHQANAGLRVELNLLGFHLAVCCGVCFFAFLGAVPVVGKVFGPLGTMVRAVHGPRHPAINESLETLFGFCLAGCSVFGFAIVFFAGLLSWGLEICRGIFALQDPLLCYDGHLSFFLYLSFSLSCCLVYLSSPSLSFLLCQALGKHKPFSGLCFP